MKLYAIGAAVVAATISVGATVPYNKTNAPLAGPVVKIQLEKGHGSAVHIGNGYFLTAAHVVSGQSGVKYLTDAGERGDVEVLWAADGYDVALVRADSEGIAAVNLQCRIPSMSEDLQFRGNPSFLDHISTWGRVSGTVQGVMESWPSVVPVDGTLIGGMSGGAVLDKRGDLVGLIVGGMVTRIGIATTVPMGVGFIVPGSTLCNMMGKFA